MKNYNVGIKKSSIELIPKNVEKLHFFKIRKNLLKLVIVEFYPV